MKISVFDYIDYVQYLEDWFEAKKKRTPHFSYKVFAEKIGLKSGSSIAMIIGKTRKISKKQVFSFCKAMELNDKETKYFQALVMYKDSKDFDEKNYYWDIIQSLRPLTKSSQIEKKKFEYFRHWYIPVLREVVTYFDFQDDFELLGKQLVPAISRKEAEYGFKVLLDLNLIRLKESVKTEGKLTFKSSRTLYEQTDTLIVTPKEYRMIAVHHFQKQSLDLARSALTDLEPEVRNIQTTTIGTSEQGAFELNKLIEDFQARVLKIADDYPEVTKVFNINIQMHPLSKGRGE